MRCPPGSKDLVTLPGVGRKTANVVLGNAFGKPGITVDTHFGRLARRFGWTTETDPVKVEHEVGALFPRSEWTMLSHRLIWHGRRVCHARRPRAVRARSPRLCPSYGEGEIDAGEGRQARQDARPRSRHRHDAAARSRWPSLLLAAPCSRCSLLAAPAATAAGNAVTGVDPDGRRAGRPRHRRGAALPGDPAGGPARGGLPP